VYNTHYFTYIRSVELVKYLYQNKGKIITVNSPRNTKSLHLYWGKEGISDYTVLEIVVESTGSFVVLKYVGSKKENFDDSHMDEQRIQPITIAHAIEVMTT
jgi:hypothetical protein